MATTTNPRHRVLRAAGKVLNRQLGGALLKETTDADSLPEDYMQLHSFFIPGLVYGTYEISTSQFVQTLPDKADSLTLNNNPVVTAASNAQPQLLDVLVPQFSLPAGAVHSYFPPSGQPADANILPHIVFNDAHLPWECPVGPIDRKSSVQIPWLALLVFTQDELKLSAAEMAALSTKITRQSSTLDVSMTASDFLLLDTAAVPNFRDSTQKSGLDEKIDGTEAVNAIFIETSQFVSLFADQNAKSASSPQSTPYIARYQQLAHVRRVNTSLAADAGTQEQGTFSVVISSRTAPLDTANTTDLIVHLVSLENVDKIDYPPSQAQVGLASLFSWSFKALSAEGAFNVQDAMRNIGMQAGQLLRAPLDVLSSLSTIIPEEKAVLDRMQVGYSLIRYRTQKGDETVAFMRGPLSPVIVAHPPSSDVLPWPTHSSSGTDYQILDPTTCIMDLSYSTAWQLGKTLAIADRPFCAALGRLRQTIHQSAMNQVKATLAGSTHRTRKDVISSLSAIQKTLASIAAPGQPVPSGAERWQRGPQKNLHVNPIPLLNTSTNHMDLYASSVQRVAASLSMAQNPESKRGNSQNETFSVVYNEFNKPANTDWAIVLKWCLDRMFLAGIPAHYLVGDPSFLPKESLRFFHIDANWIDVLLDGALSVANQLSYDDDRIRQAIKANINAYLQAHGTMSQIPTFGFLLRSHLVAVFPDLKVEVALPPDDHRTPNAFTQKLADDILLVLTDRIPGDKDFSTITITQPPHQQCYRLGTHLTAQELTYDVREAFTVDVPSGHGVWQTVGDPITVNAHQSPLYDWTTNVLNVPLYALQAKQKLLADKPGEFQDDDSATPGTAALVALELNDSIWYLQMTSAVRPGTNSTRGSRQIYGASAIFSAASNATFAQATAADITPMPPQVRHTPSVLPAPRPIAPTPITPRAPDVRRIRPYSRGYDTLPARSSIYDVQQNLLVSCGSLSDPRNITGILPNPVPAKLDQPTTLVFNVSFGGRNVKPLLPLSEIAIHIPLDVPAFKSAWTIPPSPLKAISVPLLSPDITQARVIKMLGTTQPRWNALLTKSVNPVQFLTVRLVPKVIDAMLGSLEETMSFLLGGVKLSRPKADESTYALCYIGWTQVFLQPSVGSGKDQTMKVAVQDVVECTVKAGVPL